LQAYNRRGDLPSRATLAAGDRQNLPKEEEGLPQSGSCTSCAAQGMTTRTRTHMQIYMCSLLDEQRFWSRWLANDIPCTDYDPTKEEEFVEELFLELHELHQEKACC
jgi:hypothetical protein